MVKFSEIFLDKQIVASLMQQLSWTHFVMLIPFQYDLKRDFYAELYWGINLKYNRYFFKNTNFAVKVVA